MKKQKSSLLAKLLLGPMLLGGVANAALVAHYTFDGTITDSSGNGRDLTLGGGSAAYTLDPSANANSAYQFNITNYLYTNSMATGGTGTVAFWLKYGVASDPTFIGGSNLNIWVPTGSTADVSFNDSSAGDIFTNASFLDDFWHHIAVTFSGAGTATVYIDGTSTAPNTNAGETLALAASFYVGARNDGSHILGTGAIDDLQIYDTVLTAGNITTIMNGGTITAPTVSAVSTSAVASTTATLNATSNQTATGYWTVLLAANANTPDAMNVIQGEDQGDNPAIAHNNAAMTAATAKAFSMTGLTASTAYKVYFVAQAGGLNSTVSSSSFTTTAAVVTIEDSAPVVNGGAVGDGNGDGTPDSTQTNVDSSQYGGTNWVTAAVVATPASTVTVTQSAAVANLIPSGFSAPAGKFAVNIAAIGGAGTTQTIALFIPYNATIDRLYKLNRVTGVYDLIASTVTHYPADNKTKIEYAVADGSVYDQDGADNGAIQDPVIPAGPIVGVPLSPKGYIALALSFLGLAWHGNRRRKLNTNYL